MQSSFRDFSKAEEVLTQPSLQPGYSGLSQMVFSLHKAYFCSKRKFFSVFFSFLEQKYFAEAGERITQKIHYYYCYYLAYYFILVIFKKHFTDV